MGNAQRATLWAAEQVPRMSKTLTTHLALRSLAFRAKWAMFCVTWVSPSVQMNQATSLVIWTRACPRGNNPRTHRPHEEKSNTAGTRGSAPARDWPHLPGPGVGAHVRQGRPCLLHLPGPQAGLDEDTAGAAHLHAFPVHSPTPPPPGRHRFPVWTATTPHLVF